MPNRKSQLWTQAAIAKMRDRSMTIECPICGQGSVEIEDLFVDLKPVEARVYCTLCDGVSFARYASDYTGTSDTLAQMPTRSTKH